MSRSIDRPPPAKAAEVLNRAALSDHLKRLLWMLEIDCVLDVGAYVGDYGTLVRDLGYRGRIISFEPVRAAYEQLERRSADDDLWTVQRLALGRRAEERTIHVARAGHFSSLLAPNAYGLEEFAGLSEIERTEVVPVERLEGVLAALDGARVFLKVDAQGSDLEVLEGAGERLEAVAAVQFEAPIKPVYAGMPTPQDLVAHLGARGFELTGVIPVTRDRHLRLIELDCLMVRAPSG